MHTVIPDLKTHIKVINYHTIHGIPSGDNPETQLSIHHNGIARETLIQLTEINGACTRIYSSPLNTRGLHPYSDSSMYQIQWLNQSIHFDFQKSLAPDKLLFDSEWHSQQTIDHRNPYVCSSHLYTATWLAHVYGMGANIIWYWGRNGLKPDDRGFRDAYYGSLANVPSSAYGYMRGMLDVNANAEAIAQLVNSPRPVGILYSDISAIHNIKHTNHILATYEALAFLGLKPGFITESMISNNDQRLSEYAWIIVTGSDFVKDSTVKYLTTLQDNDDTQLTIIGDTSLSRNEYGDHRPLPHSLGMSDVPDMRTVPVMLELLDALIPDSARPPVRVVRDTGKPFIGVLARSAETDTGVLVSLVNVLNETTAFELENISESNYRAINIINGEHIDLRQLELAPNQVMLLEIAKQDEHVFYPVDP